MVGSAANVVMVLNVFRTLSLSSVNMLPYWAGGTLQN